MPFNTKEKKQRWAHEYYLKHPERSRYTRSKSINARIHNDLVKREVFLFYSGGSMQCAFCGMSDLDVLCIDHVNNNGREHRRSIGNKGGSSFYRWLKKNNYPEGYQVLCANCNQKKQVLYRRMVTDEINTLSGSS